MEKKLFEDIERTAHISTCERYRHSLGRHWDRDKGFVLFIMLNPSTADANKDDPTIRRCMRFAEDWGYGGIEVCNLFDWRATDRWRPAESIADAFQLVAKMRERGWFVTVQNFSGTESVRAKFVKPQFASDPREIADYGDTFPEAITRAAVLAVRAGKGGVT